MQTTYSPNDIQTAIMAALPSLTQSLAQILSQSADIPSVNTSPLFRDYAEQWFTLYKTSLKPTSQADYHRTLTQLIYPSFADKPLSSISTDDIQALLNSHSGIARSSVRKIIITLGQIFKHAVREKLIPENPVDTDFLINPSHSVQKREALCAADFRNILSHIAELHLLTERRFLALLCYTGMRRGEVLGLRWEDIDLEHRIIAVERNVTYPGSRTVIGTPKSRSGLRKIPICDELISLLEVPDNTSGYVVSLAANNLRPISKSACMRMFASIRRQIDLHGATPHILRHTFATAMNNAGVNPKTLQYIMGHADIGITMNLYTHTDMEAVEQTRSILGKLAQ